MTQWAYGSLDLSPFGSPSPLAQHPKEIWLRRAVPSEAMT